MKCLLEPDPLIFLVSLQQRQMQRRADDCRETSGGTAHPQDVDTSGGTSPGSKIKVIERDSLLILYPELLSHASLYCDLFIELGNDGEVTGDGEHNDEEGGSVGHQPEHLQIV